VFSSCNNDKGSLVSVNNDEVKDGANTEYGLSIFVKQDNGMVDIVLVDDGYGVIGYTTGSWVDFWTDEGSNSTFTADCSLSWSGGSASYEGGLYEIATYNNDGVVFSQFLGGNTNYQGSNSGNYSVNLSPSTHYKYRMSTVLITDEDKK